MAFVPDTKDWTWTTREVCPECGFDPASVVPTKVGARVRANAALWPDVLAREDVAVRPDDSTWSPLEYACHVRDVQTIYRFRLGLMLDDDDPLYPNWDQDATAVESRYGEQDPAAVAHELAHEAALTADAFDAVGDGQWARTGRRTDGASFTVTTFATYYLHDIEHHAYDVDA
ncbi:MULTISPECIES: DinB family protein [Mumia]|uniref:DinB family protein n=1 Tax=Mumia TaxID=1546255 RepID=UPI001422EDF3|nr:MULTISPECIES: DinB family protein [unclassified Mumia]QMW65695.1 DinB family protein [Mumia sp. ZJ1417]